MWLDADSLRHWMCTADNEVAHTELNPVVGGSFRFDMLANDGHLHVHTGQYLEIQRPEKLKFTWKSTVLGEYVSQVTVEFYQQAENCLMVLVHDLPPDEAVFEDHRQGWNEILDLLEREQQAKNP